MPNATFIFAHRSTDVWNTPLSIVREFEARGWNTFIVSLFDKDGNYSETNLNDFWDHDCDMSVPDILIYMDWGQYNLSLDRRFIPNTYCVMESGDDPQNFDRNYPKAHQFDLILTPAYDSYLKYKERGHNVEWWPHFTDDKIYQPVPANEHFSVVSSRGPGGSQFLDYLSQIMPGKFINRNGLIGKDHSDFLASGAIILQNSRWKEITRRIFEGMSCGAMVLTDRLPEHTHINDIFTEGEDIVYYDGVDDCISKINYYLHNWKECNRIATNGYSKTITHHTQVQRVDTILAKYQQFINQ